MGLDKYFCLMEMSITRIQIKDKYVLECSPDKPQRSASTVNAGDGSLFVLIGLLKSNEKVFFCVDLLLSLRFSTMKNTALQNKAHIRAAVVNIPRSVNTVGEECFYSAFQ